MPRTLIPLCHLLIRRQERYRFSEQQDWRDWFWSSIRVQIAASLFVRETASPIGRWVERARPTVPIIRSLVAQGRERERKREGGREGRRDTSLLLRAWFRIVSSPSVHRGSGPLLRASNSRDPPRVRKAREIPVDIRPHFKETYSCDTGRLFESRAPEIAFQSAPRNLSRVRNPPIVNVRNMSQERHVLFLPSLVVLRII